LRRVARCVVLGLMVVAALPAAARAEIVHLSTGRTLSVQSHRLEGEWATLVLRAGGEVTCPASLIVRVVPDEVAPLEPMPDTRLVPSPSRRVATPREPAGPYAAMILSAARRHEVDPLLLQAVIRAESNFDPRARSRRGARGLMQLMPSTLRQYVVDNPYDPAANIDAGTRHLRGLLDRFELKEALAAYNAGKGAVLRHRGVPPFAETEAYVSRVLRELSGPPAVGPATSNP
jgi:Transglycosylase SLT domain